MKKATILALFFTINIFYPLIQEFNRVQFKPSSITFILFMTLGYLNILDYYFYKLLGMI